MCEVIYNSNYNKYNLGDNHPFNPVRIEMVIDLLKELNCFKVPIKPDIVSPEKLTEIHNERYIETIEAVSRGEKVKDIENIGLGTLDNPIVFGMAEGARIQSGGTLLGSKLIIENKAKKVIQFGGGFHHAHKNFASGFCIYNDLALAINEFVKNGMYVVYLDIDVHHGDGVQEIFYDEEKVMTISFHESGEYLFPGTGWIYELGQGMGRSLKLNVPLEPFTEGESYLESFDTLVSRALQWFNPDVLVVQTGADAHYSDPLADLLLTTQDYEKLFRKIIFLADKYSGGKSLFTFGGGYSITAAPRIWSILYMILFNVEFPIELPKTWLKKWEDKLNLKLPEKIHDENNPYDSVPRKDEINKHNKDLVRRLLDAVSADWI